MAACRSEPTAPEAIRALKNRLTLIDGHYPSQLMDVVLAIDIGGTKMAAGLMTMAGELIDFERVEIDHSLNAAGVFAQLREIVESQLARAVGHHQARPVVVGVGSAGPVTPNCATVSPLNIAVWRDYPLRDRLQAITQLPVYGDLDAKALALAEGWVGAAVGRKNFMAMVVSTGVGGGIVIDGQLLDGATGNAGHIGHVIVEPNGRRCVCGARGCLEAEASGPAIEAITGRSPTEPTYDIMVRTGKLVGRAVASVCNALDLHNRIRTIISCYSAPHSSTLRKTACPSTASSAFRVGCASRPRDSKTAVPSSVPGPLECAACTAMRGVPRLADLPGAMLLGATFVAWYVCSVTFRIDPTGLRLSMPLATPRGANSTNARTV